MLPHSLTNGWNVVGQGKTAPFEAALDGVHVDAQITADRDEVTIATDDWTLVMRLDVFEQITTFAIIAAHSRP